MAVFHGKQGQVTWKAAGATAFDSVISWTINASCDAVDASAMQYAEVDETTHWKDYLAGYNSWTAKVECCLDDSGPMPDFSTSGIKDDDGDTAVFFCGYTGEGTRKYSGSAIVTAIRPNVDKNGVITCTYELTGTGALSVAAA